MIGGVELRQMLVVVPLVALALAAALVGLSGRGADDAFLLRQENPVPVRVDAVEDLMLTAPDPDPPHAKNATRATCRPKGRRELRNPWQCTVDYPSGNVQRYVVTLKGDGSYVADYVGDSATATGCCLRLAAAD